MISQLHLPFLSKPSIPAADNLDPSELIRKLQNGHFSDWREEFRIRVAAIRQLGTSDPTLVQKEVSG